MCCKANRCPTPDEKHLLPAISEALKREGETLLNWTEKVQQFQNRVLSLRKWRPTEGWPDLSTPTLLLTNPEWLTPYLVNVEVPEDLLEIDLLPVLKKFLTPEQRAALAKLAPATIALPDGYEVELLYMKNGKQPVLEVRLQDIFDWQENPTVDGGEMHVLLNLLTPDLKPLATVADLGSFWAEKYSVLREELVEKFPGVKWR